VRNSSNLITYSLTDLLSWVIRAICQEDQRNKMVARTFPLVRPSYKPNVYWFLATEYSPFHHIDPVLVRLSNQFRDSEPNFFHFRERVSGEVSIQVV